MIRIVQNGVMEIVIGSDSSGIPRMKNRIGTKIMRNGIQASRVNNTLLSRIP